MRKLYRNLLVGAALLASVSAAIAGGYWENLPSYSTPEASFTIPMDTNFAQGRQPQTVKTTLATLASSLASQSIFGGGFRNSLIGGDFGTNLWQRGTAASSDISNTLTYYADGWWNLGGASSAINVTKETGATDVPPSFAASLRFQRKSANADTAAICMGQVLPSAASTRFQGRTAEFSFWALEGANFSGASGRFTATIGYGAGTDQSAASFAAGTWTTQVNTSSAITGTTTWTRYSMTTVIPNVPAGQLATQLGVKICYTPVGTAGANDWLEFAGLQLDSNAGAVPYDGSNTNAQSLIASFERTPPSIEAGREYWTFWRLAEPASTAGIDGTCQATGANTNICNVNLPVVMRTIPTITITTAGTFKVNIAGTPTTIATPTASVCSTKSCAVTAANTNTAGQAELLSGGGGTGKWDVSAEL